ncbi:hypothetical protein BLA29_005467, partial [Euroglyphus maynei]
MTASNDDLYLDFLNSFNKFDANFNKDDDDDNDEIDKLFGRRPGITRKDISLHLEDSFLKQCKIDRFICEKCHRSRLYYCYTCFILSPMLIGKIPEIRLPIRIDIIKHPQELSGKSTSTHAIILAPQDVRIFTYPDMPDDWHDYNK